MPLFTSTAERGAFAMKWYSVDFTKCLLIVASLLILWSLAVPSPARSEQLYPGFECRASGYPQIRCESHHVFPQEATWRVYYWNDRTTVANFERGLVVFLTAPDEHFTVLEMRYRTGRDEFANVRVLVRWKDKRIQFLKENAP